MRRCRFQLKEPVQRLAEEHRGALVAFAMQLNLLARLRAMLPK